MELRFPPGFVWGGATASYQIEGAADEDGRGPSIWDTFSRTPGKVWNGDTGDVAIDHYHRYAEDIQIMADLGLSSYRFSIAWPRIQPDGVGAANQKGLDFYRRLVDGLLERGIAPAVTLYHWDLPQALQDDGGWAERGIVERFARYAEIVYEALSDRVSFWTTLNEPWCSSYLSYYSGEHAPGLRDEPSALRALHHLLLSHGRAMEVMRASGPSTNQVGITLNLWTTRPASDSPEDAAAAQRLDGLFNRAFLDPLFNAEYPDELMRVCEEAGQTHHILEHDLKTIAAPLDFLGVNYYSGTVVRSDPDGQIAQGPGLAGISAVAPPGPKTAMGWPIEPEELEALLLRLKRDYPPTPLYITENGAAFLDYADPDGRVIDDSRISYLDGHFRAAHRAIEQGVDLRGFFVWSLFDNYEWAWGYSRRFGVIYVDYPTGTRIWKKSAHWYRDVIARNAVADDLPLLEQPPVSGAS
ncbi:MAG TPA: GH1 family beta-glucosidase [Egibacteraceae bacterium]|nr:GH1 family beta-glucosidase [Egibacteraceae bacterium]